jgi:hypothetical protein
VVKLEQSQPFAMNDAIFRAMCAIIRNTSVEQAAAFANYGFIKIMQAHVGFITASPEESIEILFYLWQIAVFLHLIEWRKRLWLLQADWSRRQTSC